MSSVHPDLSPQNNRRPRIPAAVWMLGLVSMFMDISSEMIQTLLPFYLVGGLGASVLAVGFIEGLSVAIATVVKLFAGVFADWTGRNKPLAVAGYGLAALSRLIFPLAASVDLVVMAKAMDRVGKGIRGAPRDAMVAAASPPEIRGASFGLRKSFDTIGGFAGPLIAIGAMILLAGDIPAIFWIAALPALLAVAVLVFAVREPSGTKPPSKPAFRLSHALRLNSAVWAVIGLAALIMLARFSEAFVLLKSLEAGFSPTWSPLTLVIMHAAYGLTAYPVGRLSDRVGTRGFLLLSLVLLAAAHLTLAGAASVPVYLAGAVLWGLHMGFSQGLLGAMIAGTAPDDLKGTAFGVFNLTTGIVALVGNVAAGWLWLESGAAAPFWVGAGLSLLAALFLLLRKSRPS